MIAQYIDLHCSNSDRVIKNQAQTSNFVTSMTHKIVGNSIKA